MECVGSVRAAGIGYTQPPMHHVDATAHASAEEQIPGETGGRTRAQSCKYAGQYRTEEHLTPAVEVDAVHVGNTASPKTRTGLGESPEPPSN